MRKAILVVLALLVLGVVGCDDPTPTPKPTPTVSLSVQRIQQEFSRSVSATATAEARAASVQRTPEPDAFQRAEEAFWDSVMDGLFKILGFE